MLSVFPSTSASFSVASSSVLEHVRDRVWHVPRNFLALSHEVVGRGRFGSVIRARVNVRGVDVPAVVQVVPCE
jgi:hypothetical protein